MNDNLITLAKNLAHNAHASINQIRKYTGEPYHVHTDAVAALVADTLYPMDYTGLDAAGVIAARYSADCVIAAAHLHDYREDVVPTLIKQGRNIELGYFEQAYNTLPIEVRALVAQLTDLYTSVNYPTWNRGSRKVAEAERISNVSNSAKLIKLADLFDNTSSIVKHDPEFAVTYLKEKERVLRGLVNVNDTLFNKVANQLADARRQMAENALQDTLNKAANK